MNRPAPLPVADAFAELIAALKAEAVSGDFDRTAAFLQHAQRLAARWDAGEPPHTVRTPSKKPAATGGEAAQ